MAKEGKEKRVMLTKPLSIEAEENQSDYSAPNLLQRILSLFAHVRPGSDLSRFQNVWATESASVWSEVSEALMRKDWDKANEAKRCIENTQRKHLKERESKGQIWNPKHFTISRTDGEAPWDCFPLHQWVPPAPIIAP